MLSLSQLGKMLCLSCYCICFLFNKIRDKGRQNRFCLEARGVGGKGRLWGIGGRNDPNNVCTCEQVNNKISFKRNKNNIIFNNNNNNKGPKTMKLRQKSIQGENKTNTGSLKKIH
jgi:hypothetical protein